MTVTRAALDAGPRHENHQEFEKDDQGSRPALTKQKYVPNRNEASLNHETKYSTNQLQPNEQ